MEKVFHILIPFQETLSLINFPYHCLIQKKTNNTL